MPGGKERYSGETKVAEHSWMKEGRMRQRPRACTLKCTCERENAGEARRARERTKEKARNTEKER